jgi:hypothetical protein
MLADPPGRRLELVRGRVLERSLAVADQGLAAGHLGVLLGSHIRQHQLGKLFAATGFLLAMIITSFAGVPWLFTLLVGIRGVKR